VALTWRVFPQESRFDHLANLPFVENRPTKESVQTWRDELLFQRGTQAYLLSLPLITTRGMKLGSEKVFGAGYNILPVWKKRLDARIWFFTNYYSISPGMLLKIPGKGAAYMIAFTDSEGEPLSRGANYHLNLPANIPAANFWSVTLYEAENASGLANGQSFPSLGSRDKPTQNADGSTDIHFAPTVPGGSQGNWLATVPGKGYFAILRLYGRLCRWVVGGSGTYFSRDCWTCVGDAMIKWRPC